jgi:hypothetical protein
MAYSSNKAYLSHANLQTVIDHAATPYIPLKSNNASDWSLSGKCGQDSRASHDQTECKRTR